MEDINGNNSVTIIMYGIKNCDTVKKARTWLEDRGMCYSFHDYKASGIDRARLSVWADELGWDKLLNRAGTTFRKLPDTQRENIDRDKAIDLMLAQPSMIKRPLLDLGDRRVLGFKADEYQAVLA